MRRYQEEHQRRRRHSGPVLTLRSESVGSKQKEKETARERGDSNGTVEECRGGERYRKREEKEIVCAVCFFSASTIKSKRERERYPPYEKSLDGVKLESDHPPFQDLKYEMGNPRRLQRSRPNNFSTSLTLQSA